MHTPVPVGAQQGLTHAAQMNGTQTMYPSATSGPQTVILASQPSADYVTNYNRGTNTCIGIIQICIGGGCILFQVCVPKNVFHFLCISYSFSEFTHRMCRLCTACILLTSYISEQGRLRNQSSFLIEIH